LEVQPGPTRPADNTYTYEFSGWSPTPSAKVTENKTYTAVYIPTYIEYTITFNNWDGSFITGGSYHY
jgi:hypothetical protein